MTKICIAKGWRGVVLKWFFMMRVRGDDPAVVNKAEAELLRMAALAEVAEKLLGPVEQRGKQRKDVAALLKLAGEPIFHKPSSKRSASRKDPRHETTGELPGLFDRPVRNWRVVKSERLTVGKEASGKCASADTHHTSCGLPCKSPALKRRSSHGAKT